ncbi:dihydrolipoyllysine-residue acetyltransferase component 3 of pyruvate dehydrogenase complex, mitochondrial-like [Vigna umbellata]|uniref:dihydrolipoyllysine-residue acetyltransferase component 3 of pyruvate dehydrogenase complex, mitochondrial-like n=1 Tax=Vigna umbellata TaxID=87088 RepID=UPI001F5E819B|nr:dihydrolipoyllysine-residue acetyltransferase component 3 of pyruvate dehydrogenase complex, mitochondrial-like [Vigna umbellata]
MASVHGARKCECPFRLKGKPYSDGAEWVLKVMCGKHIHELVETLVDHSCAGRLNTTEQSLLVDMTKNLPPQQEIGMPSLSPTMTEGNIARWLKKEGDKVSPGEVLCEVETDKATVEMESMEEGYLAKIVHGDGEKEIKVGEVLMSSSSPLLSFLKRTFYLLSQFEIARKKYFFYTPCIGNLLVFLIKVFVSEKQMCGKLESLSLQQEAVSLNRPPALLSFGTQKRNISVASIKRGSIIGSGFTGLFSKGIDSNSFIFNQPCPQKEVHRCCQGDAMRQPQATALALRKVPQCNSSWTNDYIRQYNNVNINVAVQTDNGLFVPVIRDADKKGLSTIGEEVKQLAKKAKENSLKPQDYEGGTFTVSNLGGPFGVKQFCAIINPPQSGILALASDAASSQVSAPSKAKGTTDAALDYIDIPVSQIRKVTASRLLLSKQTIPHYYLTVDACVDKLMSLRSKLNSLQEASGGSRISVNDLVIKASALALRKVPQCNSSWTNDYIRQYNNVNINVAVQTDNGLFVPVIRDADKKGLSTIGEEVKQLAKKAKENSLKPQDYEGGTFTVSNLGGPFGVKQFCAIINPPQSGILAVGSAERRVIPGSGAEDFKFGSFMSVTLSCDHRVIDGAIGAEWLKAFKGYIENPESMLL